jgi:hypothetical protein
VTRTAGGKPRHALLVRDLERSLCARTDITP